MIEEGRQDDGTGVPDNGGQLVVGGVIHQALLHQRARRGLRFCDEPME